MNSADSEGEYPERAVATGRQLGHLRGTVNVQTAAQMPGHDTASASLPLALAPSDSPGGRERAPPAVTRPEAGARRALLRVGCAESESVRPLPQANNTVRIALASEPQGKPANVRGGCHSGTLAAGRLHTATRPLRLLALGSPSPVLGEEIRIGIGPVGHYIFIWRPLIIVRR